MPPTQEFLRVFRTQHNLCRALLELSRGQADLIDAENYPELMTVLTSKQALLQDLEHHSRADQAVWKTWSEQRGGLAPDARETCEQVLAETQDLLRQLTDCEQRCTQVLTSKHQQTATELKTLSEGAQTLSAYESEQPQSLKRTLDIDQ